MAIVNLKPGYDSANENHFGPAKIEHRTAAAELKQLGTYFMTFNETGFSDPWTVQYEETIYVIEGQAHLIVIDADSKDDLIANAGELLVLPKGTTVQYGAQPGTRLLLSIAPVHWRAESA